MFIIFRTIFLINDVIYDETGDEFFYTGPPYIIGNFFASMATFGIMFAVEKYVYKKLHFVPSLIIFISAILILVLPSVDGVSLINIYSIIAAVMGAIIPILYLIVGFQVSGETRRKSFILAVGLLIFMISLLMYIETVQEMAPIFEILSPILAIVGMAVFHYGFVFYGSS